MLERGAGILTRTRFFLPLGTSLFRRSAATPNDEERGGQHRGNAPLVESLFIQRVLWFNGRNVGRKRGLAAGE